MSASDNDIAAALMTLAKARGPGKSFCPSEAARRLSDEWRPLLPHIRRVAKDLPLIATRRGAQIDPDTAHGPIRLSLAPQGRRGSRG
ncbi:DUF3253 domain-containing protein [Roseivivax sediminis]|nr:DUF3253 domain-containing protein [Roseivivax sediminis]